MLCAVYSPAHAHPPALPARVPDGAAASRALSALTAAALLGCASSLALLVLALAGTGGERGVRLALSACALAAAALAAAARARTGAVIASLRDVSRSDPLTGLLNRRGFEQAMEVELARALRNARPLALLAADLDHFKALNDRRGHGEGDHALRVFAEVAIAASRRIDLLARTGGEEFVLLLPGTDSDGGYRLAERVREAFAAAGDHADWPTVSFGVACFPALDADREALMTAADRSLYAAKALGRNRTVVHTAALAGALAQQPADARADGRLAAVLGIAETLDFRASAGERTRVEEMCALIAAGLHLPLEHVRATVAPALRAALADHSGVADHGGAARSPAS
jgi:diguanylate cyclase (GGDEF)-like protein